MMTKLCGLKLFDFAKESITDAKAWRRLGVLLRYLDREMAIETSHVSFDYNLANLSVCNDPKVIREVAETCYDTFLELFNRIQYEPITTREEREKAKVASIEQQYRERIGDPNDPELIKKIQDSYVRLQNGEFREVSKEEEIARIVAERQAQRQNRRRK